MAKRSRRSRPEGRPRSAPTPTPAPSLRDRVLDAALTVSAREGWAAASLAAIAAEAGLSLAELYAEFRSRPAILAGLMARTDRRVLAGPAADADEGPRERLFEILMRRFDALKPERAALQRIARGVSCDLPAALLTGPPLMRSMAWMLEAAGISTAGLRGRVRVQGLAMIYLSVMRVFLGDESDDLAKTMAALDRRLRQADQCLGMVGRWRPARAA